MKYAHVGHRYILRGYGYWQKCTESDEGCIGESSWVNVHASEGRLSETSSGGLLFTNISSEDEGLYRTRLNRLGVWMYYKLTIGKLYMYCMKQFCCEFQYVIIVLLVTYVHDHLHLCLNEGICKSRKWKWKWKTETVFPYAPQIMCERNQ